MYHCFKINEGKGETRGVLGVVFTELPDLVERSGRVALILKLARKGELR